MSYPQTNAIDSLLTWLEKEYGAPFELGLGLRRDNPWIDVVARPVMPYEPELLPDSLEFAIWRATGAVHRCLRGEVQDPPIIPPAGEVG